MLSERMKYRERKMVDEQLQVWWTLGISVGAGRTRDLRMFLWKACLWEFHIEVETEEQGEASHTEC